MAQWLRTAAALLEDPGSIPINGGSQPSVTPIPENMMPSSPSDLRGHQACIWHTDMRADKIPTYIKLKKKNHRAFSMEISVHSLMSSIPFSNVLGRHFN